MPPGGGGERDLSAAALRSDARAQDAPATIGWPWGACFKRRACRALVIASALLPSMMLLLAGPAARAVTRALIIGIDDYAHVQKLHGAVADTRDLEQTLRRLGVTDILAMRNADARRGAVLAALEQLSASARAGDSVLVHFAGHGAREPERIVGSKPDRLDQVFLLQPFDPQEPNAASEKILDSELNHYVRRLEAAGARAILVLDACSGIALAREIDARAMPHPIYRTIEYTPVKDHLASVGHDGFAFPEGVKRSWLLAAADQDSRIAELNIANVGPRGALSYALARGLEGAADLDGDGTITARELGGYVRQVAHQFSEGRQTVVTVAPEGADVENFAVASYGRGISVRPSGSSPGPSGGLTILPVEGDPLIVGSGIAIQVPVAAGPGPSIIPPAPPNSPPPSQPADLPAAVPIKLASLDGKATWFASLLQSQSFAIVPPTAQPDLVWDPRSRDVLAGSDVVARSIDPPDLAGVIEQLRVLERLKQRSVRAAQPIILLPSDQLHTKGMRVQIEVRDLTGRFLVLFNVSGTGAVQLLYPLGSDPPQPTDAVYSLELQVRDPFGAEHIVAVTAGQRLSDLEALLRQSSRRLNADRLGEVLNRFEGRGTRVGYVGLFTSP